MSEYGASRAWSNLEIDCAAIKEAVAVSITGARNVNRLVEWFRGLKMCDLGSEIGHRHECAGRHFPLQTQVPRLRVSRSEIGIGWLVNTIRDKRHVGVQAKRMRIPASNAGPRIVQTSFGNK